MMRDKPYVASDLGTRCLFLVYDDGWKCEWPIQYQDGRIAYDWPERIPRAAKRLVERAIAVLTPKQAY